MARKQGKPKSPVGAVVASTQPVLDATREASQGPLPPTSAGSGRGGSVMGAPLIEGTFVRAPAPAFVESPFGERYISSKPKTLITGDVLLRAQMWAFSMKGYQDYGTPTNVVLGLDDGEVLLQDWYSLVRDMAKRTLKYKHLPTSLTDTDMLRKIMDVYFWAVANTGVLLNLNRLLQYNQALANVAVYVPRYASRITRVWRRLSTIPMPPFLKAHAVRNSQIVFAPGVLAPTLRLWSPLFLLASGSGGPTITSGALNYRIGELLTGDTAGVPYLQSLVNDLESVAKWLEVGTPAIIDDFVAVKDLIDMSADIVPGTFTQGIPQPQSLPGLSSDPGVITDLLRRAVFRKDVITAGTDRWIMFPVPEMSEFGDRIPVCGFGQPTMYDFCLMGAPKYGIFGDDLSAKSDDVDSDIRVPGTDFQILDHTNITVSDIRSIFGSKVTYYDEEIYYGPAGTVENLVSAFDVDVANTIREQALKDSLRGLHPWDKLRYGDRETWSSNWVRAVEEVGYGYVMYQEAGDLGWNHAEFLGKQLAVPYFR